MAIAPGMQIVEDLEKAFQACLSVLTNPDHGNMRDSDELRTAADVTIQNFLDVSKRLDCFFIQKRLLLSVQKPEHLLLENIQELNNELQRKEQLLAKYHEKIQTWQNLLQDVPGQQRPVPPNQPQQTHPSMPPPQPQMAPQVPPQGHPHPMQPHPQVPSMQPGMVMQQPQPMPPQMHAQMQMGAQMQQQQGPGGLQGPLAYLERTMSNIGMPEQGR